MLSERVYRWLLFVYPKEHRREYGELMVQLFRDRMRRDGGGFHGALVWMQMIFDLLGAAFKEHKEGKEDKMKNRIGIALVAVLLTSVVGATALFAQSQIKEVLLTSHDFKTFTGDGVEEIIGKLRQAEGEGAITQEMVDEIEGVLDGDVPSSAWLYSFEADGLATALQQAVAEGFITQGGADRILLSSDGRSSGGQILISPQIWTFTAGADGVAGALGQAVEEGVISQTFADQILQSLGGGRTELFTWHDFKTFTGDGAEEITGKLQQAVEEGVITQEMVNEIARVLDGDVPSSTWLYSFE
ncbi:MAG: hypothetical protein OXI33_16805, partial [Chloroflexota bacterium]|nr:hypothetical protein [Chloroflexota bacterium]